MFSMLFDRHAYAYLMHSLAFATDHLLAIDPICYRNIRTSRMRALTSRNIVTCFIISWFPRDSLVSRVLLKSINRHSGAYDRDTYTEDYTAFMTTPGTHDDTYAGTCHRMFFANWSRGVAPRKDCPGMTDTM